MPITLLMHRDRSGENAGFAIRSLNWRCGSEVIRHIERFGEVLRECGSKILTGLSRGCRTIYFFAEKISHNGSAFAVFEGSPPSKFFFCDEVSFA